jgi:hypothetical protein
MEAVKLPFDKVNIQQPKHQPSHRTACAAEFQDYLFKKEKTMSFDIIWT